LRKKVLKVYKHDWYITKPMPYIPSPIDRKTAESRKENAALLESASVLGVKYNKEFAKSW
jgi:hypothetical protein